MEHLRILPLDSGLSAICDILLEPHVLPNLSPCWRSLFGLHKLLSRMESDKVRVYGSVDGSQLKGFVFGAHDGMGGFVSHIAYRRHVNAAREIVQLIPVMVREYACAGVKIDHIVGNVDTSNRAARMVVKRIGCVDAGQAPGMREGVNRFVLDFTEEDLETWEKLH